MYDLQTSFYKQEAANWTYGIPLDASNSSSIARAGKCSYHAFEIVADWTLMCYKDWAMFAAAATTDTAVRDAMINQVYAYASANLDTWPFPVIYSQSNASQISGASRFVLSFSGQIIPDKYCQPLYWRSLCASGTLVSLPVLH